MPLKKQYFVEFSEDDPIIIHGPYELEAAKQFARIGSQMGGRRRVTQGLGGQKIREYEMGKRIYPAGQGNPLPPVSKEFSVSVALIGLASLVIAYLIKTVPYRTKLAQNVLNISPGGLVTGPGGVSYQITPEDKLWLGRAVQGETGSVRGMEAVCWALLQNFALIRGSGGALPRVRTFSAAIRNYSQPVSPLWVDPNSAQCQRRPDLCTPDRIQHRLEIQSMAWGSLSQTVRTVVDDFVTGRVANPVPRMVDFANYDFEGAVVNIGGNNFGTLPGNAGRLAG